MIDLSVNFIADDEFDKYNMIVLEGDVEVDKREIKYNKGEPKGHIAYAHKQSNVIYPADNIDANTLLNV